MRDVSRMWMDWMVCCDDFVFVFDSMMFIFTFCCCCCLFVYPKLQISWMMSGMGGWGEGGWWCVNKKTKLGNIENRIKRLIIATSRRNFKEKDV